MSRVLEYGYRPISVEEYHRMVEARVFDEDERLELLEGVIVPRSPQSPRHAYVIQWLSNALPRRLRAGLVVRPQLPLTLGERSEPEPDFVVASAVLARPDTHPTAALLVVEVAWESLPKDRLLKASLYARAAIPEYWIVNLDDECVEVHREPEVAAGRYSATAVFGRGQELRSSAVPEISIWVEELFGAARG